MQNNKKTESTYPIAAFAAALSGDFPNASMTSDHIAASEAAGKKEMIESSLMPKDGDWAALEKLGFVRGEESGDLFYECTLPKGWKKEGSDHNMWSYVFDERGLRRVSVFYKAAFYGRSAHFSIKESRFHVSYDYETLKLNGERGYFVCDGSLKDRVVKRFDSGWYVVQDGVLGLAFRGEFFSEIEGQNSSAHFVGEPQDFSPFSRVLTGEEFYKEYHHVTPVHALIDATENLVKRDAEEWVESIPASEQWSEKYDFEAV